MVFLVDVVVASHPVLYLQQPNSARCCTRPRQLCLPQLMCKRLDGNFHHSSSARGYAFVHEAVGRWRWLGRQRQWHKYTTGQNTADRRQRPSAGQWRLLRQRQEEDRRLDANRPGLRSMQGNTFTQRILSHAKACVKAEVRAGADRYCRFERFAAMRDRAAVHHACRTTPNAKPPIE